MTLRGRLWAAVLACGGPGQAALSHRTAAAEWDLTSHARVIDVTTLAESRSRTGIRVHRGTTLNPLTDVVRQPDGLPVTTAMRALQDLADGEPRLLRRACRKAHFHDLLDTRQIREGARGAKRLRAELALLARSEPQLTRSELEERFLDLVAEAGLAPPQTNTLVEGFECDFVWRAERLIVETDGRDAHLNAMSFEDDRARDATLVASGWRVIRFTWRQIVAEPERVVAVLRAAGLAGGSPGRRCAA